MMTTGLLQDFSYRINRYSILGLLQNFGGGGGSFKILHQFAK